MPGVKWYIKMVTDRSSKKKVEDDQKESADKSRRWWQRSGKDSGKAVGDELTKGARRGEREAKKSGNVITKFFKSQFGILAGVFAGIFAVAKIVAFTRALVKLGVDGQEVASKYKTTFGEARGEVDAFIASWGRMAGLTSGEAQEATASLGAMAQGMGFARKESAALSMEVMKLAGDLTSFHNIPLEQTTDAISSALVGQTRSLRTLGIVIQETDIQQRALAMSGKATADALTQQERAAATLALIHERMGPAAGDLERTQDSLANSSRRVSASWRDFKEALGGALVQADQGPKLLKSIDNAIQAGIGWVNAHGKEIQAWANGILSVVMALTRTVVNLFKIIDAGFQSFWGLMQTIKGGLNGLAEELINNVSKQLNKLFGLIDRAARAVGKSFDFRLEMKDTSAHFALMDKGLHKLVTQGDRIKKDVGQIVDSWGNVASAIRTAGEEAASVTSPLIQIGIDEPKDDPAAREARKKALEQEIALLVKGAELRVLSTNQQQRLNQLHRQVQQELKNENLTLQERVEKTQILEQLTAAIKNMGNGNLEQEVALLTKGAELRLLNRNQQQRLNEITGHLKQELRDQNLTIQDRIEKTMILQQLTGALEKALDREVGMLTKAHELGILTNKHKERALQISREIARELKNQNLELEERIRLMSLQDQLKPIRDDRLQLSIQRPLDIPKLDIAEIHKRAELLTNMYREEAQAIESAYMTAAYGISGAFSDAFRLAMSEGANFGSVMQQIMQGVAASFIGAVASYASSKVAENIAQGFEYSHKAKAMTALATVYPPAAASAAIYGAAAQGAFVTAGKWAIVAGVAGGAAAAVGGGGGGGGGAAGRSIFDQERITTGTDNTKPQVFNFYVDPFNPKNPVHQDKVGSAAEVYIYNRKGR